MMNIREYFDNLRKNARNDEEFDDVCEYEYEVYQMDDDEFDAWLKDKDIDLTATQMVGNHEVKVITLWGWDFDEA